MKDLPGILEDPLIWEGHPIEKFNCFNNNLMMHLMVEEMSVKKYIKTPTWMFCHYGSPRGLFHDDCKKA